jgi:hypothetical protein
MLSARAWGLLGVGLAREVDVPSDPECLPIRMSVAVGAVAFFVKDAKIAVRKLA